jgi:pimeloyl-ACP methyl ester carboxylesterase
MDHEKLGPLKPQPTSISELLVPNSRHRYFENAEHHPFRDAVERFDVLNAWWLAEASFLAYVRDRRSIGERLIRTGFYDVRFIRCGATFCYVAAASRFVIVCFRGTDVAELENLLTDVKIRLVPDEGGGRVHSGFKAALDLVWRELSEQLSRLADGRSLWFTGHSLGAALATLAARRFPSAASLYTFGSPRVGDQEFNDIYPVRAYRVVNDKDMVAFLPPPFRYRHVGMPVIIQGDGKVTLAPTAWDRLKARFSSLSPPPMDGEFSWRTFFHDIVLRNSLSDHAPIHYVVRLWNAYIRGRSPGPGR